MAALALVTKSQKSLLSVKASKFYDVMAAHLAQGRFTAAAQAFRYFRSEVQETSKKLGNFDVVGPAIKAPGLVIEGYMSSLRKNEGNFNVLHEMRKEACEAMEAMAKDIIEALNA